MTEVERFRLMLRRDHCRSFSSVYDLDGTMTVTGKIALHTLNLQLTSDPGTVENWDDDLNLIQYIIHLQLQMMLDKHACPRQASVAGTGWRTFICR